MKKENVEEFIPTLKMLTSDKKLLQKRSQKIADLLQSRMTYCQVKVVPSFAKVGSGAFPCQKIPSYAVCISSDRISIQDMAKGMRSHLPPIFARMYQNCLYLEPITLLPGEETEVVDIIIKVYSDIAS